MFNAVDGFPTMSPIVAFTGPVVGSGLTLLHNDPVSGLSEAQLKCCGLVQLSTFIAPGNPAKPPFRGLHHFQVFVIFPIHVNPWMMRCKKMVDRQSTQFLPGTMLSCTGRVVALLNHQLMIYPPKLPQDLVFMVVPDSWSFLEKPSRDFISALPQITSAKPSASDPRSRFMTPIKHNPGQPSNPITPDSSSTTNDAGMLYSPRTYDLFSCRPFMLIQTLSASNSISGLPAPQACTRKL